MDTTELVLLIAVAGVGAFIVIEQRKEEAARAAAARAAGGINVGQIVQTVGPLLPLLIALV